MAAAPARSRVITLTEGARVTPVELFLDLVFVYGFTQVTQLMSADYGGHGLIRGMVMLGLLWWLWVGYSWLGNVVQADEGPVRMVLFLVMALVFIVDITIPEAFTDIPGGLYGPWVFAAGVLAVQAVHVGIMLYSARRIPRIRRNTLLLLIPAVLCFGLLMWAGALAHGAAMAGTSPTPARMTLQTVLWTAALIVQVGSIFLIRAEGWQLSSASHFAERHGLIIIVALGESIVSIGVGVSAIPVSWEVIAACALGITVCATLWWAYFDVVAIVAEDNLHHTPDADKPRLARDSYTFLHLPMIAGIILLSLGLKKVFQHLEDPLKPTGVVALFGGVSLYLWAHVAFRLRNIRTVNRQRVVVAVLLLVLIPVAMRLPALAALGLLAVIMVGLIGYEVKAFAEVRDQIRHGDSTARP